MYMSDYNKNNTNMMVVLGIVMLIVGFTVGKLTTTGENGNPTEDQDSIEFDNQIIYTEATVGSEYFWLTGKLLNEIGNPHNSVAIRTFDVSNLEVNQFTYVLATSDEGSEIFIIKLTPEGENPFQLLEYFNETSGDVVGDIALVGENIIRVYIFFEGIHIISIEGIFEYV